ncbi:ABC transporter permease [Isoptericola sp. NPDC019482]|uniref:ABC transporter permease n=1 Tax=Isoptericola sp. NPDC019482 TaxID=3154688 RepID=UPI00347999CE
MTTIAPQEPTSTRAGEQDPAPDKREAIGRLVAVFLFPLLIVAMMVTGTLLTTHNPTPHDLPIAVVGPEAQIDQLIAAVDAEEPGAVDFEVMDDAAAAQQRVVDREIAGAVRLGGPGETATIATAGAAGPSQASLVQALVAPQLIALGIDSQVSDLVPLGEHDTGGVAVMFLAMAFIMAGYMPMSLILSASPKTLRIRRIVPILAAWATVTAPLIWWIVGPLLGAFEGHALPVIGIGWLSVFTVGLVQVFLTRILGPMASLAAVLFISVLGGPASGLTSSIHTMPGVFAMLQQFLPTPATGQALASIIYFDGNGAWPHILVLILGALVAFAAILAIDARRRRNPEHTDPEPTMLTLTGGSKPHSALGKYLSIAMFPVIMIVMLLSTLLASTYQPSPKDMPIAVVAGTTEQAENAVAGLEQSTGELFDLRAFDSTDTAADQVRSREVVAAYQLPTSTPEATLTVNQAAGVSQAKLVESIFRQVADSQDAGLRIDNLAPVDARDSAGSVSLGIAQGWMMAGILIVIVAASAAPAIMRLRTLLPILGAWALFAPAMIWLIAGPIVGAVSGDFLPLYGAGVVAVFATATVTLVFSRLIGLYAVIPAVGILVFLGVPASGGALSIYMTPEVFRLLHDVLPMPAAVESIRSILYFGSDTLAHELVFVGLWGAISLTLVMLIDKLKPVRTTPLTAADDAHPVVQTILSDAAPASTQEDDGSRTPPIER